MHMNTTPLPVFLLTLALGAPAATQDRAPRPNIVVLFADDHAQAATGCGVSAQATGIVFSRTTAQAMFQGIYASNGCTYTVVGQSVALPAAGATITGRTGAGNRDRRNRGRCGHAGAGKRRPGKRIYGRPTRYGDDRKLVPSGSRCR